MMGIGKLFTGRVLSQKTTRGLQIKSTPCFEKSMNCALRQLYFTYNSIFSIFLNLGESFATTRASIAPTTSQGNRGIQFVQI